MALEKYRRKRKFAKTPEPPGKPAGSRGALKFVVQKHHARRLHYDFRIELDGVLKSWAVPKGPSLDPSVKRLAMMVEDHPFDYLRFEGTIPAGNYGAGKVIVWDIGTLTEEHSSTRAESEKALRAGLKKGHIAIVLAGKKLKGVFDLVRMEGREENAWLMVKRQDEHASDKGLSALDKSAISSRRLADPQGDKADAKKSTRKKTVSKPEITRVRMPENGSEKKKRQPAKGRARAAVRKAAHEIPFPIKPMLCTLVDKPFDGEDWLFEVKWDGYRAIGQVDDDEVRLYSRNGNSFADNYPEIYSALPGLGRDCVLDGEVIALAANGKSTFQALQNFGNNGDGLLRYVVFDLLFLDGHDLRDLPLRERKELLEKLITKAPAAVRKRIFYSEHAEKQGIRFFAAAVKQGLEGMIAKRADSRYRSARGRDWLKIKAHLTQEAVIGGFTEPRGARKAFGALILGVYDGDELRYIGHTGTGFDYATLQEIHGRLTQLVTAKSPFAEPPKTNTPATWVKPKLLCQVEFAEWTGDGRMRHPSFVALRDDKSAKQVHEEQPQPVAEVAGGDVEAAEAKPAPKARPAGARTKKATKQAQKTEAKLSTAKSRPKKTAGGKSSAAKSTPAKPTSTKSQARKSPAKSSSTKSSSSKSKSAEPRTAKPAAKSAMLDVGAIPTKAKLTNPDKLYWPQDGITKGEMLAYYAAVADWMIPYIKDRPLSLNRYPDGIEKHNFFQKDVDYNVPPFVKTADLPSESRGEKITWLIANNRDALLYVANLGSIEINPWNSRLGKLDKPDYAVVDLDPDDNPFEEVVKLAQLTRKVLDRLGIEGYCKTSGQSGLHIYIPLGAKYSYEQCREFAHLVVKLLFAQSPGNTSLERMPPKRRGRIYLDYLQNRTGQTLAAPYSVRPVPGAPVSTPLKWSEVKRGLDPREFTIFTTLKRMEKVGDLFAPVLGPGIDLKDVLSRLER